MSSATKREGGGPDGAVTARFEYPVPGTIIAEKYRVERTLGEGGMGLVVSATHMGLEQEVAIKFLLPDAMRNEVAVERFLREAKVAAKIKSDYVARVHDVGTLAGSGGVPYIVMEHLHGSDLGQLIEQNGALAVEEACEIVLQACEGRAQVHAAGIVHRDLKPSNVFVTRNADGSPAVKLLDFGISKLTLDPEGSTIDPALTATATIMGSPSYMSPEQLRSTKEVDGRADVWSLGAVLYEAITGAPAFRGETLPQVCAMIASEDPVPPSTRRADLPEELEACILRCLDKNCRHARAQPARRARARWLRFAPAARARRRSSGSRPRSRRPRPGAARFPWSRLGGGHRPRDGLRSLGGAGTRTKAAEAVRGLGMRRFSPGRSSRLAGARQSTANGFDRGPRRRRLLAREQPSARDAPDGERRCPLGRLFSAAPGSGAASAQRHGRSRRRAGPADTSAEPAIAPAVDGARRRGPVRLGRRPASSAQAGAPGSSSRTAPLKPHVAPRPFVMSHS